MIETAVNFCLSPEFFSGALLKCFWFALVWFCFLYWCEEVLLPPHHVNIDAVMVAETRS